MNVSIMQPYLFPYIGYFQMLNVAEYFVIADDVQYIKKGWINRNRILYNDEVHMITIPVIRESTSLNIKERHFVNDPIKKQKILNFIYHAYCKAPHFEDCYELIERVYKFSNNNIAGFLFNSLKEISLYLDLKTTLLMESEMNLPAELDYQESIIYVCKKLKAERYINSIGGMELYSSEKFKENDITLKFIKTRESLKYKQFNDKFVPNLSIIDVMMFNSQVEIRQLLTEYDLIDGKN